MYQKRNVYLIWPILLAGLAFARQEAAQAPADKLMEVDSIGVKGTRLPSDSVIRLSGIKLHDRVNDSIVNAACHKITATGLVKTVDYAYDAYPDRPGVALILTVADEGPLLPAAIKPAEEENSLWSSLQALDRFSRGSFLPPRKRLPSTQGTSKNVCRPMDVRMNTPALMLQPMRAES